MAEGWCRALRGDEYEAYSAGIEPLGVNASAARVMQEVGVDISKQESKTIAELGPITFDRVVTVCGNADERCPRFAGGTEVVHVPFDDPPKLAAGASSEEEALQHYRRVRDEIREYVASLPVPDSPDTTN